MRMNGIILYLLSDYYLSQHGVGLGVHFPGLPAELHDGDQDGHGQAAQQHHENATNVHHVQC